MIPQDAIYESFTYICGDCDATTKGDRGWLSPEAKAHHPDFYDFVTEAVILGVCESCLPKDKAEKNDKESK